ncbi:hypothetical protein Q9295_12200 [Xinfangfangia sp. CPCC 101601]|uniref:Protein ImuA n=1 Tax=Pseudogemmobacter lacusdianii TaxID=3069608 RepID=A0ABU0VZG0_9RHOB|nr:hypothetical protein [Xinfangfangia sp. CPCC 101601]MDQ2067141.1 hypothetical protein [Xinfangfangia sp. CPCC 101601]
MRTLRDRLQAGSHDQLHLVKGRVHEVEGRGRTGFALYHAARLAGPIFWILLTHDRDRPMPAALPDGVAERLHFIEARDETNLLWTVEEALRARPVSLVIAALGKPISLTAGRRLQLAAEAGDTTGIVLIHEGKGSNAAETRWKCDPLPSPPDSTRHRWVLNKNKRGTIGIYDVSWNGATAAVHLVPQAGERHQPEGPPR